MDKPAAGTHTSMGVVVARCNSRHCHMCDQGQVVTEFTDKDGEFTQLHWDFEDPDEAAFVVNLMECAECHHLFEPLNGVLGETDFICPPCRGSEYKRLRGPLYHLNVE